MATGEVDSKTLYLCIYPNMSGPKEPPHGVPPGLAEGEGSFDWFFSSNLTFCSPGKVEGQKEESLRYFPSPVLNIFSCCNLISLHTLCGEGSSS